MDLERSDVVVSAKLDDFDLVNSSTILFTLCESTTLPNIGIVDDHDIVQFDAITLGDTTSGTYTLYFNGEDVGLDRKSERPWSTLQSHCLDKQLNIDIM